MILSASQTESHISLSHIETSPSRSNTSVDENFDYGSDNTSLVETFVPLNDEPNTERDALERTELASCDVDSNKKEIKLLNEVCLSKSSTDTAIHVEVRHFLTDADKVVQPRYSLQFIPNIPSRVTLASCSLKSLLPELVTDIGTGIAGNKNTLHKHDSFIAGLKLLKNEDELPKLDYIGASKEE